jgi:hypothetical protein
VSLTGHTLPSIGPVKWHSHKMNFEETFQQ